MTLQQLEILHKLITSPTKTEEEINQINAMLAEDEREFYEEVIG